MTKQAPTLKNYKNQWSPEIAAKFKLLVQAEPNKEKINNFNLLDIESQSIDNAVDKLTGMITDIANQCNAIKDIKFRKSFRRIKKPIWHTKYIWNLRKQIINLSRDISNNPNNRRIRHLCFFKMERIQKIKQKKQKNIQAISG